MNIIKRLKVLILAIFMFCSVSCVSLAEVCMADVGNNVACGRPINWQYAYKTVIQSEIHKYKDKKTGRKMDCFFNYTDFYYYYRCDRAFGLYHIKTTRKDRLDIDHHKCGKRNPRP